MANEVNKIKNGGLNNVAPTILKINSKANGWSVILIISRKIF